MPRRGWYGRKIHLSKPEELEEFNGQALTIMAPFKILSWTVEDKTARLTGRVYQSHVAVCSPSANQSIKFRTRMLQSQKDQIRAILFLNPKSLIQATVDGRNTKFSGVLPPS